MKDNIKSYPKYKEVDISWLKCIPEHWKIQRAKNLYEKVNRPIKEDYDTITCFRDGVVTLRKNRRTTGFTESIKEIGYQGIYKGDLVIHVMDAFAGAVGVSDSEGKSTPVYSVCIPKGDYNNYYYAHVIREMAKTGFIQSLYRGIRERSSDFRFEVFGRQFLPIPTENEQIQIVNYLNSEISRVNKFIKHKKKEILLLKEQKQAEKNHAITRGVNPNVTYKRSGFEWIGDIPSHWEIVHLRGLLKMTSVKNMAHLSLLSVVREKGVIMRDLINDKNHNFVPDDLSGYKSVKKGDFVINKMKAWQGSCGVSNFDGIVSPAYYTFELDFENKDYFNLAIRSKVYVNFFTQFSGGIRVGQWDLSSQKLKSIPFFVPTPDEQKQIEEYLRIKEEQINRAISAIEKEITLIQEYKTSLISDVVTGKVDVRNVAVVKIEDVPEEEMEEIEETEELENTEE